MAETQQEKDKRATRRFALRLPVSVRYGEDGQEHTAETRDVERPRHLLLRRFGHPSRVGH